jgi:hypothetical protein
MAQNIQNILANNFTFRCVISIYIISFVHTFFSVDFYQHLAFFLCGPSPGTEVIDRLNAHTADQKKYVFLRENVCSGKRPAPHR